MKYSIHIILMIILKYCQQKLEFCLTNFGWIQNRFELSRLGSSRIPQHVELILKHNSYLMIRIVTIGSFLVLDRRGFFRQVSTIVLSADSDGRRHVRKNRNHFHVNINPRWSPIVRDFYNEYVRGWLKDCQGRKNRLRNCRHFLAIRTTIVNQT